MKATELLTKQHKKFKKLLESLPDSAGEERRRLFEEVGANLAAHDAIERRLFYPAVERAMGMDQILGESLVEHGVIEFMLYRTDRAIDSTEFTYEAIVLRESVLHHAAEEERDLFPEVESKLSVDELEALGERMLQLFEKEVEGDFREAVRAQLQGVLLGGMKAKPRKPLANTGNGRSVKPRARAHT
jgi:hemerythrin superfamily protein